MLSFLGSVAPAVANDGEDVHEEVDDVQVEVQGGEHVLLGAERVLVAAPDHELRVVHDVQTEDDCPDPGVHEVQGPAGREEGGNQSEQHKTHQHGDQDTCGVWFVSEEKTLVWIQSGYKWL